MIGSLTHGELLTITKQYEWMEASESTKQQLLNTLNYEFRKMMYTGDLRDYEINIIGFDVMCIFKNKFDWDWQHVTISAMTCGMIDHYTILSVEEFNGNCNGIYLNSFHKAKVYVGIVK